MVKKGTKKPRELVETDRFPAIEKELRKQTKAVFDRDDVDDCEGAPSCFKRFGSPVRSREAGGSARL